MEFGRRKSRRIVFKKKTRCIEKHISSSRKQIQKILGKLHNLGAAQLRLSIHSVDKRNGHLANCVVQLTRPDQHLHLEHIAFRHALGNQTLQHVLFVQPKRAGHVRTVWSQQNLRQIVGAARHQLSLEIPTGDSAVAQVPSAGH